VATARELMTKGLLTIEETVTLETAFEIATRHAVRHLPVVDDDGRLVGMLSDRDLRAQGVATIGEPFGVDRLRARLALRVRDVMARDLVVVAPEDDLAIVLDRLIETRYGAVPVVERRTDRLLGLVSYVDVLRALRDSMRSRKRPPAHPQPH
jgi:acetoin utilization protein AcuB